MAASREMQTFAARIATFHQAHQLSKRRASSQAKTKSKTTVEWPHQNPAPEELARAGFFYRPAPDSLDNAQCFLCTVKLDGWEPADNPLAEHLAHSPSCAWALSLSVARNDGEEEESRDPLSPELSDARRATFDAGAGWCHEDKRGWGCKVSKMVEAGWCFDPSPETEDGVTCFYCNLSLDGWEPKDDPFEEHRRRSGECPFFALVERWRGAVKKGKGKAKGRARGSTASKVSRLSEQSAVSVMSEAPSMASSLELGDAADETAGVDSILTAGTVSSHAGGKGKKKGGRTKAVAKGAKGKKANHIVDHDVEVEIHYPMLSQPAIEESEEFGTAREDPPPPVPPKATRKGTTQSKQPDSSVISTSQPDSAPKKGARGRKAKPEPDPESEPKFQPELEMHPERSLSDVSAQLQEELERSFDYEGALDVDDTPKPAPKPKRGVKRSSTGAPKPQDSSVVSVEFPAPPKAAVKGKKGGKKKKVSAAAEENEVDVAVQAALPTEAQEPLRDSDVSHLQPEPGKAKPARGKKSAAKKGSRGKKASSTSSSRPTGAEAELPPDREQEDLERDEREIEAELERMAAEQRLQQDGRDVAIQLEQEKVAEFEPSPSHKQIHVDEIHANRIHDLEHELQAENDALTDPGRNMAVYVANVAVSPRLLALPLPGLSRSGKESATPSPSPSGSDKENQPSSLARPQTALKAPPPLLSPGKTTRIPLAPGTPNRASPSKHQLLSPTKHQLSTLTSAHPWTPADLDILLLPSPQPSPARLAQQLLLAAPALTSPEKGLSVEEWVRWRAGRAEELLRSRCEGLVGAFEREGVRALECLAGVGVG